MDRHGKQYKKVKAAESCHRMKLFENVIVDGIDYGNKR